MRLRIGLATAVVSLALPALASADTFCVNKSPCPEFGASKSTVQEALVAAAQNPGLDVVRVGARPEPYAGPFAYDEPAFNPVQIVGDGPGQTVLVPTFSGPTLRLGGAGSKVSGVTIVAKAPGAGQSESVGLELVGADAENVSVEYGGSDWGVIGVLTRHDADIRHLTVDMSMGVGVIAEDGPQGTTLRESEISAQAGVYATDGATATLRDVSVSAVSNAVAAYDAGELRLSNALLTTSSPSGIGVAVGNGGVTANHVTLGRRGPATSAKGLVLDGGSVSFQNTIIDGYPLPILRRYSPAGNSNLSIRYTNVDLAAAALNEGTVPGTVDLGPGNRNVDPSFAAPGDFHLRGDSKLIDMAEFTTLSDETDIEGLDRNTDGDGDYASEADIGAYEYQRKPPFADFSAGPATAGAPVAFDASASSDADPGDESGFTYSWRFGDGGTASGRNPEHVYAQPGDHTVILIVTDPAGLRTGASRVVSVAPAAAGGDAAPAASPVTDVVAPVISGLRVSPRRLRLGSALARLAARGGQIRFGLSEPARVTLRFQPVRSGSRGGALRLNGRAGLNSVRFAGRLTRRRSLKPGTYRLTVLAKDAAGNVAKAQRTRFVLLPRR